MEFNIDKEKEFPSWYEQIVLLADIVDKRYPVKGMPVFKPNGFFMHEKIMRLVEDQWEMQGIEKAQFPLLIPYSFLAKEGNMEHMKGFEDECFWVTHGGTKELEMKLALRPTSETAMYSMFSLWIQSFRDLPLKVHQTCSIYRHETKDTRPLIRVREVPWNEAHTCHATEAEAIENLEDAWRGYLNVFNGELGVFGARLRRPDWDRFAGACHSDVLDVVMPSGKVLQAIGAHYLGQKFSRPFDIQFLTQQNEKEFAYMTCYGVSTRILAAALSVHGDQKGLILPPVISRNKVVVIPIIFKKKGDVVKKGVDDLRILLKDAGIRFVVDDSEKKPGEKFYYWEMRGIPLRIEIGPRDIQNKEVRLVARDTGEKKQVKLEDLVRTIETDLKLILERIKAKAKADSEGKIFNCTTLEEVSEVIKNKGGFARFPYYSMGMDGKEGEEQVKEICGAEIRGYSPSEEEPKDGILCIVTGKPAKYYAYAASAY